MTTSPDLAQRIETFTSALAVDALLVGNDPASVHTEYIRALVESLCDLTGLSNDDHHESVRALCLTFGQDINCHTHIKDMGKVLCRGAEILLSRNDSHPPEQEVVSQMVCTFAGLSPEHTTHVQNILLGFIDAH